jgi:DNA-directed RNA polymerase specialized sigma24 family protein
MTNTILLEFIPSLRAFAQWLTGSRVAGDTLVRETLARAWQIRSTYVSDTSPKAWLFNILRDEFYADYCTPPLRQESQARISGENAAS